MASTHTIQIAQLLIPDDKNSWQGNLLVIQLGLASDGILDTAFSSFARVVHFRISVSSTLGNLAK